jgi:hypothetical protein
MTCWDGIGEGGGGREEGMGWEGGGGGEGKGWGGVNRHKKGPFCFPGGGGEGAGHIRLYDCI